MQVQPAALYLRRQQSTANTAGSISIFYARRTRVSQHVRWSIRRQARGDAETFVVYDRRSLSNLVRRTAQLSPVASLCEWLERYA